MADDPLERFVAAGPQPGRALLRALIALGKRPRGRLLLRILPLAEQTAESVLAMARYDDPATARALGWDAEAVARRGLQLRRDEGRP